jgi:acyl-CoA thioesterase
MLDDKWMLYASESPVGHAARSLIFGGLYSSDGVRFASVAQEGLIRALR